MRLTVQLPDRDFAVSLALYCNYIATSSALEPREIKPQIRPKNVQPKNPAWKQILAWKQKAGFLPGSVRRCRDAIGSSDNTVVARVTWCGRFLKNNTHVLSCYNRSCDTPSCEHGQKFRAITASDAAVSCVLLYQTRHLDFCLTWDKTLFGNFCTRAFPREHVEGQGLKMIGTGQTKK